MKLPKTSQSGKVALIVAGCAALTAADLSTVQAASVRLNGNVLQTQVAPVQRNGRTLVPMRDIFLALGAQVNWNSLTREIAAQHGSSSIRLQIGNRDAMVNGQRVRLEQAPLLYRGITLVPLRFVAEGLGADVHWNASLQQVSISTQGTAGQPGTIGGGSNNMVTIPANIVIPVRMATTLSSADARVGDVFTARVRSQVAGDAEFPVGTQLEGVVTRVQRRRQNSPGLLDLRFRAALLPGGARVPLRGELIDLDDDSVNTNAQGRLVARAPLVSGKDIQIAGVGQGGAGFVLGEVVQRNGAVTQVRGTRGNVLYGRNRNSDAVAEAVVPRGAQFGVRLVNALSFADTTGFRLDRQDFIRNR